MLRIRQCFQGLALNLLSGPLTSGFRESICTYTADQIAWSSFRPELTLFWKSPLSFLKPIFSFPTRCLLTALFLSPPLPVSWTQLQLCKMKPWRQQLCLIVCVRVFPVCWGPAIAPPACALCVRLIVLALARAAISIPPAGQETKRATTALSGKKRGMEGGERRSRRRGKQTSRNNRASWIQPSLLAAIVTYAFCCARAKTFEWKTSSMNMDAAVGAAEPADESTQTPPCECVVKTGIMAV